MKFSNVWLIFCGQDNQFDINITYINHAAIHLGLNIESRLKIGHGFKSAKALNSSVINLAYSPV